MATESPNFQFSALPMGSGRDDSAFPLLHKRVRFEDATTPEPQKFQTDLMESAPSVTQSPTSSPASYASTLLQPLGAQNLNSVAMLGDFVLEDDDFHIYSGTRGRNIDFSHKVEDKLNLEWGCAAIIKLMGRPHSDNAFKFMLAGLK